MGVDACKWDCRSVAVAWALGLIVGINMVFGGASMIGMALGAQAERP
jgi:uncharacterized membrane protein HdeD (DUF308 family)